MHLNRCEIPSNECPAYNAKQSDGKTGVMLELLRMRRTLLLPSLLVPLWTGYDRVISMGEIDVNCALMLN